MRSTPFVTLPNPSAAGCLPAPCCAVRHSTAKHSSPQRTIQRAHTRPTPHPCMYDACTVAQVRSAHNHTARLNCRHCPCAYQSPPAAATSCSQQLNPTTTVTSVALQQPATVPNSYCIKRIEATHQNAPHHVTDQPHTIGKVKKGALAQGKAVHAAKTVLLRAGEQRATNITQHPKSLSQPHCAALTDTPTPENKHTQGRITEHQAAELGLVLTVPIQHP